MCRYRFDPDFSRQPDDRIITRTGATVLVNPASLDLLAGSEALIIELAEAAHANQLSRALGRWERLDLTCIDELGYVPLAETACELMFQVIAE